MLKKYWFLGVGVIGVVFTAIFFNPFNSSPAYLYKVTSVENWEHSKGGDRLKLSAMDNDFIHLSTEKQLDRIIKKFWKNESEFYVLKIETKQLPGNLVLEANPGGENKYYHLYDGFIPVGSVVSFIKIQQ